ncbi:MAG: V-type ATPase 116kDa subunit family protein, partial [Candidatus Fimimonas sp.]
GYLFAALVLTFAHLFNLAMGVLSVYIHNGRLQYVEFFGKFYTGDGTLFVPFGSDTKYTLLTSGGAKEK